MALGLSFMAVSKAAATADEIIAKESGFKTLNEVMLKIFFAHIEREGAIQYEILKKFKFQRDFTRRN